MLTQNVHFMKKNLLVKLYCKLYTIFVFEVTYEFDAMS